MKINWRSPLSLVIGLLLFSVIYWLLPISGQIAYIPPTNANQVQSWPQIIIEDEQDESLTIHVQDVTPWTHVRLEMGAAETSLIEHGVQNGAGVWQWRWQVVLPEKDAVVELYHSCETGCQAWATKQTAVRTPNPSSEPQIPTKLGVVFANPARDWNGRQGWTVEITYAQLVDDFYWGIDDLAQRVQQAEANGLRTLVRVEYDQGQSIPPPDDYAALDSYLTYLRRLARDDRLANVHGFIIGSNFNTNGASTQSPSNPVTPAWYAQVFNGYAADPNNHNNAIETIRSENKQVRVLVGPINPWNSDQDGSISFNIDLPWLNYMNTMVYFINEGVVAKTAVGISDTAPDGFAIQAFGRVDAPSLTANLRAEEPFLDIHLPEWGDGQAGFRVYEDWLAVINSYPHTLGKPIYINATNTFDPLTGAQPAENYPTGWLTNALQTINAEPQIVALCWFIDSFPHDDQWQLFSLSQPRGLLLDAAEEFELLLDGE
ncbi:MAG: hypothetical protein KC449_11515 [Anaerolineales bacterium]|nr:hypothetical protein [Anaerolineales bacterium]